MGMNGIRCLEGELCENQGKINELLATLCLPIVEAHTKASHPTDGFRPRRNENDDLLDRVQRVIEEGEEI